MNLIKTFLLSLLFYSTVTLASRRRTKSEDDIVRENERENYSRESPSVNHRRKRRRGIICRIWRGLLKGILILCLHIFHLTFPIFVPFVYPIAIPIIYPIIYPGVFNVFNFLFSKVMGM